MLKYLLNNEGIDSMKQDDGEKKKKAGNPIFILFIFVILLAFVFFVPDIYKTFNSNIAEFLGVGNNKDDLENTLNPEDEKTAMSEYYQIGIVRYLATIFRPMYMASLPNIRRQFRLRRNRYYRF